MITPALHLSNHLVSQSDRYLFVEMDAVGGITYLSPSLTHLMPGQMPPTGQHLGALLHPQDVAAFELCLLKLQQCASAGPVAVQVRLAQANRYLRMEWEFFGHANAHGVLERVSGIAHLLPEVAAVAPEPTTEMHSQLLAGLLAGRSEATFIVDNDHRVVVMNEAAQYHIERITGRKVHPGFSLFSVFDASIREKYEAMNDYVQVHGCFSQEMQLPAGSGEVVEVLVSAHFIVAQGQSPVGMLISLESPASAAKPEPSPSAHELVIGPPRPLDLRKPATEMLSILAALNTDNPCDPLNATLLRRLAGYAAIIDRALSEDRDQ